MDNQRNRPIDGFDRERRFAGLSPEALERFRSVAAARFPDREGGETEREALLRSLAHLRNRVGFWCALEALYRYQVTTGFVLIDPKEMEAERIRTVSDPETGVTTILQWNPEREWRRDHGLLIERGIVAATEADLLIHCDDSGKPCYLCRQNIEAMNPGEVLLDVTLGGDVYYAGVNFASICDNHYTVMHGEHREQRYRSTIPSSMNDFVDATDGVFCAVYNGRAGASIKAHEHLQSTTEPFPVESVRIEPVHRIVETGGVTVSNPAYPVPLWIVEGEQRRSVERMSDRLIRAWHDLDGKHTENLIAVRSGTIYRFFILLRQEDRLAGPGKQGVMASFETGGVLVLSKSGDGSPERADEWKTFQEAGLTEIRRMMEGVAPESDLVETFRQQVERSGRSTELETH